MIITIIIVANVIVIFVIFVIIELDVVYYLLIIGVVITLLMWIVSFLFICCLFVHIKFTINLQSYYYPLFLLFLLLLSTYIYSIIFSTYNSPPITS